MVTLHEGRYRFLNVKSGNLYLGVQHHDDMRRDDDGSLALEAFDGRKGEEVLESSQVWYLVQYKAAGTYMMINQFSGWIASIRDRSKGDGATATQYHAEPLESSFQLWTFQSHDGNLLIRNVNSQLYLGPENRDASDDNYIIQYSDQTSEDPYQVWIAKRVEW